ncbi:MAG: type II toxin-antitoxin system VapC family toxin [Treponema sp.]|jgi:PIN domain nuclease of toxin-antitoxin system|nr:type II toxin-antitoxin system VapC family toxin [Treponema sp.]
MNLLLDTHALIWFFNGNVLLSEGAKQAIIETRHRKFVSVASVWEAAIKISLNKLAFDGKTRGFLELIDNNGFELLAIDKKYMLELENLPFIHRDPFDRLLVATAISEKMYIVTADANIQKYPINCMW